MRALLLSLATIACLLPRTSAAIPLTFVAALGDEALPYANSPIGELDLRLKITPRWSAQVAVRSGVIFQHA